VEKTSEANPPDRHREGSVMRLQRMSKKIFCSIAMIGRKDKVVKTKYLGSSMMVMLFGTMVCFVSVVPSGAEDVPLTPEGVKAMAEYSAMLESLKTELKGKIPQIDKAKADEFLAARKDKKVDDLALAQPILADLDAFLSSGELDDKLVKCSLLAAATPRGLAEFVQQGPGKQKLIDYLLAHPDMMKTMLHAGGAKAGRYGKVLDIYRSILAASERAKEGVFNRIAMALALELAAPELCGYKDVDPVKRYTFYEKSYLDKALDSNFDKHSIWLMRQIVNDPHTEEDMLWMREMLWNYRPDMINAPEAYIARYVGLMNTEFGHKPQERDEKLPYTAMQQWIDKGGQCGPKAFFGRCLGRSFGIPVWGGRLRSHTAMFYWTPRGWNSILGISWINGFWTVDQVEPMRAWYFHIQAIARNYPQDYEKVCRAQWTGDVLEESRIDGMKSEETGGLWNALALNKAMAICLERAGKKPDWHKPEVLVVPWLAEARNKESPNIPEPLMKPEITADDRTITVAEDGSMTIPAVACTAPTTNTLKIVMMNSRDGGKQLHYRRYELPEPFVYEVTAPKAGTYDLVVKACTVNRDQFFVLTVNDDKAPVNVQMPYTVGKWGDSNPVKVMLKAGKNNLAFNRTVPEGIDFQKDAWKFAGPEFGGISLKSLTLRPVN